MSRQKLVVPRLAYLPGLDFTQDSRLKVPVYAPVSFAAKTDNEPWRTFYRNPKKKSSRKENV